MQDLKNSCTEYRDLSRRGFMKGSALAVAAAMAPAWLPRVAFAQNGPARDVLVSIFLRGGADGLTFCAPFGDPDYYRLRPTLAVPPPDSHSQYRAQSLDGFFGLPPAMRPLTRAWDAGHLAFVHAVGFPPNNRSHFSAQRFIEVGEPDNGNLTTGWLGRHLATAEPTNPYAILRGVAIDYDLALTLAGGPMSLPIPEPTAYRLVGDVGTLGARKQALLNRYATDNALGAIAKNTMATMDLMFAIPFSSYQPAGGAVYPQTDLGQALKATAAMVMVNAGIEAFHIDNEGWDTHASQGPFTGRLYRLMRDLAQALEAFHLDLATRGTIGKVTVVVISEFGRDARENGSQGTDHGHGNAMFLLGGNVVGRRVHGRWPTLAPDRLFERQDLAVTTDYRDILAEVVSKRLGNQRLAEVFPNYTPQPVGVVN